MTRYYCSVSDRAYLPKLLALYESLLKHSSAEVCLYILALDLEARIELARLDLESAVVLECEWFVDHMKLREIRKSRTHTEWCWTVASQLCEFLISTGMREITYLDSDLYAFADTEPAFAEMGDCSIAVTPHRFIPSKQHLRVNGEMNVGWVTFRNTVVGRQCVSRWAAQVRDRCSAQVGCGDQLYLDEFVERYGSEVCILSKGINAGPWSIGNWEVTEGPKLDGEPLTCYHAHEFLEREDGTFRLTNYELRKCDVDFIYGPYIDAYRAAKERITGVTA